MANNNIAYTLQILHTSSLEGGTNTFKEAINLASLVDALEDKSPNSITLSTGDNFLPGPVFFAAEDLAMREALVSVYQQLTGNELSSLEVGSGRLDATLLNIIGFDASALGNHELDQGTSTFAGLIGADLNGTSISDIQWLGLQFPYLATNLDFSQDNSLTGLATTEIVLRSSFQSTPEQLLSEGAKPKLAPAMIIEEGGEKIGVLAVSTPLLRDVTQAGDIQVLGGETAEAIAAVLQSTINTLTNQGINKIILLSDLPSFNLDQQLIKQLQGVDVLLSGTTTFLADATDTLRPDDTTNGTYPLLTTDKDNNPALIVTGGKQYRYLGRLVLDFDADGKIITENLDPAINGMYATTDEMVQSVWEDQDPLASGSKGALVKELTDSIAQLIELKDTRIFGNTNVLLNGERNSLRTEETNLGSMLADANLVAAQTFDPTVAVAIQNAGSIRASLPVGEISQLDVETVLRFNNELVLVTVTASELKTLLENGVSRASAGQTSGRFPQVAGLRFSFDTTDAESKTIPVGQRIQTLVLVDNEGQITDVIVQNGQIVGDANRSIRVVTLKFLADGGDGYNFPSLGEDLVNTQITEQQSFKNYLEAYQINPYNIAETPAQDDLRIQNLDLRIDHTPTVEQAIVDQTATEDTNFTFTIPQNTFADIDLGDILTYSATLENAAALPSWLTFDTASRTFSGTPTNSDVGTVNIKVIVTDQSGASANDIFALTVANTNDAPILGSAIADQNIGANSPFIFTIPANTFADLDIGDSLTYTATLADNSPLPGWLTFDAANHIFSGIPPAVGTLNIKVTVKDTANATVSDEFVLTIKNRIQGTANKEIIRGTNNDDLINGLDGNDYLLGGGGNDNLDGGTGDDYAFGGAGNDDINGGDDAGFDLLYGNEGNDTIYGGAGDDNLDGGTGDDSLVGGTGNDIYTVDSLGDTVVENPDQGTDKVNSYIDYTLGANVENLTLLGNATTGTGNSLNNHIIGKNGNNTLYGLDGNDWLMGQGGNDTLYGGADNDRLDGGTGDDSLVGGTGDDLYEVDNVNDKIIEAADAGTDTVISIVDWTLADNVENLSLVRNAANGTGNNLNNRILGNSANNTLDGLGGDDILSGAAGNDTLDGGAGNDSLDGGNGDDSIDGGAGNDTLIGGTGNDILVGDDGSDRLTGGTGNDRFVFTSLSEGIDTITDFSSTNDVLVLQPLLTSLNYIGSNPITDGYIRGVQSGANTLVQIDADGIGGSATFTTLVTLNNFNVNGFSQNILG